MKKFLLILLTIASVFAVTACSSSSDDNTTPKQETNIVGVWANGDCFISFNKDGYYIAYLNDKFIDSGSYTESDNSVICKNNYNNNTTTYKLLKVGSKLDAVVTYKNFEGHNVSENISFSKTTKTPSEKDNFLIGKSYSYETMYYRTVTDKFETHNIIYHTSNKSKSFKNVWYYIYLEPNIYYQKFTPTDKQYPSSTFMDDCDTWNVHIEKVATDSNGNIANMEFIK